MVANKGQMGIKEAAFGPSEKPFVISLLIGERRVCKTFMRRFDSDPRLQNLTS